MPLLVFFIPISMATPLVALVASTIAIVILIQKWRDVNWHCAWRLIISTWIGIPVGLSLLKGVHEDVLKLVLAIVLIIFSLFRMNHPRLWTLSTERFAPLFGFFAGILGGAYNTNGPPIIAYGSMRQWTPASFRATLQGYFFPTGLAIVAGHAFSGLWNHQVFRYYLIALPFVLAAVWLGGIIHSRLSQKNFQRFVYILLLCIGMGLGVRTVYPLIIH